MVNHVTGLDAAWGFPTAAGLKSFKAHGGIAVSGYLSNDRSGKNWSVARLRNTHRARLGAIMNWETYATRMLGGHGAGVVDGRQAADLIHALIRGVGYAPRNVLHVYCSADFDSHPSQYPAIDGYLHGFAEGMLSRHYREREDAGVYGEYDLVVHTEKRGTSHAEWQTYAWSGGQFTPVADFYQWSNSHYSFGGAVDYDQVISSAKLGAWWPPGHLLDRAPGAKPPTTGTSHPSKPPTHAPPTHVPPRPPVVVKPKPRLRRAWPLGKRPGFYFGDIKGPNQSLGGTTPWQRGQIRLIQARLGVRQTGVFDGPTIAAVKKFQAAHAKAAIYRGQVRRYTWRKLFTY